MIVSFLKIKEEKIDAAKGIIVNKYAAEILDVVYNCRRGELIT